MWIVSRTGAIDPVLQRLCLDERRSHLRRATQDGSRSPGFPTHTLRICRAATLQHSHLERRHRHPVGRYESTDLRRTELCHERHPLLDDGHRRILRRTPLRKGTARMEPDEKGECGLQRVARTKRTLVSIRCFLLRQVLMQDMVSLSRPAL